MDVHSDSSLWTFSSNNQTRIKIMTIGMAADVPRTIMVTVLV